MTLKSLILEGINKYIVKILNICSRTKTVISAALHHTKCVVRKLVKAVTIQFYNSYELHT